MVVVVVRYSKYLMYFIFVGSTMETKYVGSMVSIDCGEVLGIYQGLLDGIDQSKQMLTIVDAFHDGTRCSVPRITIK